MKKLNKLLALCLALTMLLLCVPLTASAAESEYGPEDLRSIHGIDYNRITQKATGDSKSYPVELKMGELTFHGELTGSHGLTYEELNKIINEVLKEKKLTVEQIQLVKALAANVEDKAIEHWGLQIMEGLISYIPMNDKIASEIGGWNDIFAYMVHDMDEKNVIEYLADRQRQKYVLDKWKVAEGGLKAYEGYLEKVGRAADAIPLAGEMINTLKVAEEWLKGNERLEKYLKDLEQKIADVNDFYSECSRRANKLAEEKGETSDGYSIKFNNATATDTFTFWGISGLMSEWTLSGELKKGVTGAGDGVIGNYEGTLTLSMKALDMAETFDKNWALRTTEYPTIFNRDEMQLDGAEITASDTTNSTTVMERTISGEFNLYIPGASSGIYEPAVFGSFSGADDITYSFSHSMKYTTKITLPDIGTVETTADGTMTSTDVNTLTLQGDAVAWNATNTVDMNVGTVWEPLDGEVSVEIDFGK